MKAEISKTNKLKNKLKNKINEVEHIADEFYMRKLDTKRSERILKKFNLDAGNKNSSNISKINYLERFKESQMSKNFHTSREVYL